MKPIKRAPKIFAIRVPYGKVPPKFLVAKIEIIYLKDAPKNPPSPTIKASKSFCILIISLNIIINILFYNVNKF